MNRSTIGLILLTLILCLAIIPELARAGATCHYSYRVLVTNTATNQVAPTAWMGSAEEAVQYITSHSSPNTVFAIETKDLSGICASPTPNLTQATVSTTPATLP